MKVEKFKVLLYLKKSELDKSGKAPIMGRITVNCTMAQFGCKLSCIPELWNPRESHLNDKSKETMETSVKIDKLLLAVNAAFDNLVERKIDFDAADVKDLFQGSMETQMTLIRMTDAVCDDIKAHFFGQKFKVQKVDKTKLDYYIKLSDFHAQFRAIDTNYNQVVKELRIHFSEKKAMALLYKLEKCIIDLVKLSQEIVELLREMQKCYQSQSD